MIVKELRFENYRNLENNSITPADNVNVIYGENAQGKTNLLEAIWLFCGGHSFRGSKENEMIAFEKKFFRLSVFSRAVCALGRASAWNCGAQEKGPAEDRSRMTGKA